MPTGYHVVRKKVNGFRAEKENRSAGCHLWLEYIAQSNETIQTAAREGEVRIKVFQVYGFCNFSNTIYKFDGCYFYGHECVLNTPKTEKATALSDPRQQHTEDRKRVLGEMDYSIQTMNECTWNIETRRSPVKEFIEKNLNNTYLPPGRTVGGDSFTYGSDSTPTGWMPPI